MKTHSREIKEDPWENLNYVLNTSIGSGGFAYFEELFCGIYTKFLHDRSSLLEEIDVNNDDYFKISRRFEEVEYFNSLFTVLGCAIIESWINTFGIHLLHERFYQKNIERLGVVEKVNILYAIHHRCELSEDNEILRMLRILFDKRNQLIHPKPKHMTPENIHTFAFDHEKVDDEGYQMVKKTLKMVEQFLVDSGFRYKSSSLL